MYEKRIKKNKLMAKKQVKLALSAWLYYEKLVNKNSALKKVIVLPGWIFLKMCNQSQIELKYEERNEIEMNLHLE